MSVPPEERGPSPRRRWVLPVAVVVTMLVVAAAVVIIVDSGSSKRLQRISEGAGTGAPRTTTAAAPTISAPHVLSTPTTASVTNPVRTSPTSGGVVSPAGGPVPSGFAPASFTAISDSRWWLMGTAPCSSPPCTSIVRTTDAGRSFVGIPAPRTAEVSELRFANAQDGYAYGPELWSTHDGGASWHQVHVSGDVAELAISGDDVYVADGSDGLLRSPVGDDHFSSIHTGAIMSVWAQGDEVLADDNSSTPVLISSVNRGDSFSVHAAPAGVVQCDFQTTGGGVIWAPCATGTEGGVFRSPDGGVTWPALGRLSGGEGQPNSAPLAAASAQIAVYGAHPVDRTTDGGRSWSTVAGLSAQQLNVTYLGFTDACHGVAIVNTNGTGEASSRLEVTSNAGASYSPVSITGG